MGEEKEIERKDLKESEKHHDPLFKCDGFLLKEFEDLHLNLLLDCARFDCDGGDKEKEDTELRKVSCEQACGLEESLAKETPKGLTNCRKLHRYIPRLGPLLIDLHVKLAFSVRPRKIFLTSCIL